MTDVTFIDLGKYRPTRAAVVAFAEERGLPVPPEGDYGAVLATRQRAREVIAENLGAKVVVLECSGVEVMSTPFAHELAKKWWPHVSIEGANEDVRLSWEMVTERMDK